MKRNSITLLTLAVGLLSSSLAFAQLEAQTQAEDAARNRIDSRAGQPGREQAQRPQVQPERPQVQPARPYNPGYSNNYRRDDRGYGYNANNHYRYDERSVEPYYQLRRGGYLPHNTASANMWLTTGTVTAYTGRPLATTGFKWVAATSL